MPLRGLLKGEEMNIDVIVRGKLGKKKTETFKIDFVSNYARKKFIEAANAVASQVDASRKGEKVSKELSKAYEDNTLECLKEILDRNGYEYNPKIWERGLDSEGVYYFLYSAVNGEADPKKKIKEAMERYFMKTG